MEVIDELYLEIRSVIYRMNADIAKMCTAKIVPRFFDEKSCLKLVYATLLRASQKWRRVKMSDFYLALFRNVRKLYKWEDSEDGFISKKQAA